MSDVRIIDGRVGQTYRVYVSDCCVFLEFTSRLVELRVDGGGDDRWLLEATFDNGVVIEGQTSVRNVVMVEAEPGSRPTGPASPPSGARSRGTG